MIVRSDQPVNLIPNCMQGRLEYLMTVYVLQTGFAYEMCCRCERRGLLSERIRQPSWDAV
jgi:hypothetical protein